MDEKLKCETRHCKVLEETIGRTLYDNDSEKPWTVYCSPLNFLLTSIKEFSFPCCVGDLHMVSDPILQYSPNAR